ncbi:MAG TPA: phenylalanine--tRNA ligase subunit beta [Oligoflexia bacterium]|nr:phenylalanine--tRNA ligase subunit beta [Oligoflexia bacterium]
MKISREWLLEFVDFSDLSGEDFSELITTRVAEVEECYKVGTPIESAEVAEILEFSPHPERNKLSVVRLATLAGVQTLVCGANNLKNGAQVLYAPPGSSVRKPGRPAEEEELVTVEAREFAGIMSVGMILSESELGISPDHEGILLLNELTESSSSSSFNSENKFKIGDKATSIFPGPDLIIDIDNKSLTHRPDLWSHFGFAREISAILKRPLKKPMDLFSDGTYFNYYDKSKVDTEEFNSLIGKEKPISPFSVRIGSESGSKRLSFFYIGGLSNRTSPLWIRRRLFMINAGIRNLLVDCSNYVLHETGQPNHAYDPSKLSGKTLEVRKAVQGEKFTGLDLVDRILDSRDIVIADDEKALALAGILGGNSCSVSDDTREILLESGHFDPVFVRQTAKRHQVRTDSSNRFEKSISPFQIPLAPIRFIDILKRAGENPELPYAWSDNFPLKPAPVMVQCRPEYIRSRLGGVPETDKEISDILSRLGFGVDNNTETLSNSYESSTRLTVPYYRATSDVTIEDDLVEEVGRIIGFDRVPEKAPLIEAIGSARTLTGNAEVTLRESLSAQGLVELSNDSFCSISEAQELGYCVDDAIRLLNPVDQNSDAVQTTLVPGLLSVARSNSRHFAKCSGFEIGRSYHLSGSCDDSKILSGDSSITDTNVMERRLLGLFTMGDIQERSWGEPEVSSGILFYSLSTVIRRIARVLGGGEFELVPLKEEINRSKSQDFTSLKSWMHPFRSASIKIGNLNVGVIAEVRPSVINIRQSRVVIAEIDIEALMATRVNSQATFLPISRYPESFFEISIVMPLEERFSRIKSTFYANLGEPCLRSILPVAVYQGAPLHESEKSLSIRFVYSKESGTVTTEELESFRSSVLNVVQKSKYRLRS